MRDYALGTTFDFRFTTRAFATAIPTTLGGSPSLEIYADNNSTPMTAGITLTADFSGVAGLNSVRIVATSGNGFASGSNYSVVIAAGTVGGVSVVGETICEFSIEAQSPLRPTVAGRTLDVTATGAAGIDWANVEGQSTAVNLSATNIDPDQVVASVTGAVGSVTGAVGSVTGNVGGNVNGNVVGTVASVVGNVGGDVVGDVQGNVDGNLGGNVVGSLGAMTAGALADFFTVDSGETYASAVAGSVVKEIADNTTISGTIDANVVQISGDSAAADALESILDGGGGTITANITGNLSGSVGSVTGAVGSVTGNVGGNVVGSVGSVTGDIGGLAAGAITDVQDAVWDVALASHQDPGSTGEALGNASAAGDPWATLLPGAYGAGEAGQIVGDFLDIAVSSRLAPTVAGRDLDVTATGAAGIDWANVEGQATAVNLSATNIDPDQVVASVTGAVGSVTGAVGSVTGNVGGNVTGSVGSVVGNVGGNVTGSVGSVVGNVGGNVNGNVVGSVDSVVDPVTVGTNNDKTGYAIGVGGIAASAFAVNAIGTAAVNPTVYAASADALLARDLQGGSSVSSRNVRNALRPSRNRVRVTAGGLVVVYEEDDTTTAWTGAATRTAGADPLTEIDPA